MRYSEEKLANQLLASINRAVEIDPEAFRDMLETAEPGWTPTEEPGDYRWFLVRNFPTKDFNITMRDVVEGLPEEDRNVEWAQHDRIVELLKGGAAEWPAFVTATGVIFDGYHRIAAHRTLKLKNIDVVVAVELPGAAGERAHEKAWNKRFPTKR